jgi:7-keto-8-aminopelargonate synthetase-like enzyme
MDGDVAPVQAMSKLCARYKAILLVDDAHGTGVMGERGEGVVGMAGLSAEPHVIQVGTLSKALGSQGGFVTGPAVLRDLLVNTARTFIFDTALNPGAAGAALAALQVIEAEPEHLKQLKENVLLFRKLLNRMDCDSTHASPIIPVILRGEELALKAAAELREQGFMVAAIRPPTVPPGTSRLRITLSAAHTDEDIRRLARVISQMQTA